MRNDPSDDEILERITQQIEERHADESAAIALVIHDAKHLTAESAVVALPVASNYANPIKKTDAHGGNGGEDFPI